MFFRPASNILVPFMQPQFRRGRGGGGAPPTVYLLKEDFEGSGYENSWSENLGSGGTVDEDYATEALAGSHSLRLVESSGDVYTGASLGGTYPELWAYFMFQVDVFPTDTVTHRLVFVFGAGSPTLASVRMDVSGGSTFKLRAYNGDSFSGATTDSFNKGDTIHVWFHADTVSDTAEVWWNTSATRPSSGGSKHVTVTSSISTQYTHAYCYSDYPGAALLFDKVRVNNVEIGSNPD